jgi:quinol monooxygenase YgiN
MQINIKRLQKALGMTALIAFINGCAINSPYPKFDSSAINADEQLVLVISRIIIDTKQRQEFDKQTSLVIKSMPSHEGMLGFSARREIFGEQAWTLSVWRNNEAVNKFVRSAVHFEAMKKSQPAIVTTEFKRLTVKASELPRNWSDALATLALPGDLRNYGE